MWALAGGLLGGFVTVGVLATVTHKKLKRRAQELAVQLQRRGGDIELYLAAQGEEIGEEIEAMANKRARQLAQATATKYIGQTYGLTPERIRRLERVGQQIERLRSML